MTLPRRSPRPAPRQPGDLVPLRDRLGGLSVVRVALALLVLLAAVVAPDLIGVSVAVVAPLVAAALVLATAAEAVRQLRGDLPLWAVRALLLGDGVFLAAVVALTGGGQSLLLPTMLVHVVVVTLLASWRNGAKIALWNTLVLVSAVELLAHGATAGQTAGVALAGVMLVLTVCATATFSRLNERDLRASRAGFAALAAAAARLDGAHSLEEATRIVAEAACSSTGARRLVVVLDRDADDDSRARLVARAAAASAGVETRLLDDEPKLDAVVLEGEGIRPLRALPRDTAPLLNHLLPGARNVVVVPVERDGRPEGALVAELGPHARGLVWGTRELLGQFAVHLSLTVRSLRAAAEVERLAAVDALTGLANRRTFDLTLAREIERAERASDPLSLLLIDVDHFKQVNDVYGHPTGDTVLQSVAQALRQVARAGDLAARHGGEEFVVLLPGCGPHEAERVAERVREQVARAGGPVAVTASVGVATVHHDHNGAWLCAAADAALYVAKRSGRDRVQVSDGATLRVVA